MFAASVVHSLREWTEACEIVAYLASRRRLAERVDYPGGNGLLHRLAQVYESLGTRDVVQIAILAVVLFAFLRFLGKLSGSASSLGRGLSLVIVALFLLMQVIIAALDLTELSTVLDYLLTTT